MCGRYALIVDAEELAAIFDGIELPSLAPVAPRYNIAPSQPAPVVRHADGGGFEWAELTWGLIPSFSRDGRGHINARSESAAQKPTFRSAFRKRRCLIPASGFYEWQAIPDEKRKQPYFIHRKGQAPFCFAGLWERWGDVDSFAILTTDACESLESIHHRMPVMLTRESFNAWLDPDAEPAAVQELLQPFPSDQVEAYTVSSYVNSPKNNSAQCVTKAPPIEPGAGTLFG